jgi:hypothetical protein
VVDIFPFVTAIIMAGVTMTSVVNLGGTVERGLTGYDAEIRDERRVDHVAKDISSICSTL